MYKDGKPVKRKEHKAILVIILITVILIGGIYLVFVKKAQHSTKLTNSNTPLITKIESSGKSSVTVNEPLFTMSLPGRWQESSRDSNPSYQSIQWNYVAKDSVGRWVRIYVDKIPADFAVNYLLPLTAQDNHIKTGQVSENCTTFTQGATPQTERDTATPISNEKLPAKWQQVSFLCDNSHVSHKVVGTGSAEGQNVISVTGPKHGKHQYFFVYEDDNFHTDNSIFMDILDSFEAK